jgi:hypothetical protein
VERQATPQPIVPIDVETHHTFDPSNDDEIMQDITHSNQILQPTKTSEKAVA